jgi:hypothetical protein
MKFVAYVILSLLLNSSLCLAQDSQSGAQLIAKAQREYATKRRMLWLILALALMFTSAYSITRWVGAIGAISGWVGLPQFAASIRVLQMQIQWWKTLALVLPFLAAFLLGLSSQRPRDSASPLPRVFPVESSRWTLPLERYLGRLAISMLGTLGFSLCLFLVGFLLYKLNLHTN